MFAKTSEHYRLQDRVRQSSLPLKKRRFRPIKDISSHAGPLLNSSFTSLSTTPLTSPRPQTTSLLPMPQRPLPIPTSAAASVDQRLAALTLIATASADPNALATLLGTEKSMTIPPSFPLFPQQLSLPLRGNEETASPLPPQHDGEDEGYSSSTINSNEPGEPTSPAAAKTTPAGKRIRHRPLLQPLPGGCHGKSSRHNSYCRRMPCYNGSNYCKLHYRQYVRAASTSSDDMTLSAEEYDPQQDPADETTPLNSPKPRGGKNAALILQDASSPNPPHQDRRYMGGPGETRCSATTTRGRACAYVAVRNSKYCHLHADYDINPPPRRGGCGGGQHQKKQSKTSSKKGASTSAFRRVADSPRSESRTVSSEDSISLGTLSSESAQQHRLLSPTPTAEAMRHTTTTTKKTAATPSQASRRANARRKHADSPYPLLSMISTDQWSQKLVRIATGPFKDRTGNVEKWGNGWVAVHIPGVGMHNRRSFELYLHQPETEKNKEAPLPPQEQQQEQQEEQLALSNGTNEEDASLLRRCVSRDVRSPPLLVGGTSSSSSSVMNGAATVTPRPTTTVISSEHSRNSSNITNSNVENLGFLTHDAPETPVHHSSSSAPSCGATVTPSVQQNSRPETKIPLVESLLLSEQEGKKYKLDMLFGTAALERSRRSIQKPTRYEPTDMTTAIKDNKRDRKTLEDGSLLEPESEGKRARIESAN